MRPRHLRPQLITIRPVVNTDHLANVLGDVIVDASVTRGEPFDVIATISWNRNDFTQNPTGNVQQKSASATIWRKDLLKPGRPDYTPSRNDLYILDTAQLFVYGFEPLAPTRVGLGSARGSFMGWRVLLTDRGASQRAAQSYG